MNIIQQALNFVQRLLNPDDPRRCRHCGYRMTKKNGTRPIKTNIDLDGPHPQRHQNWWCYGCKRGYYVADPNRAKWARYRRPVQRKSLDMYLYLEVSLRKVAVWIRSDINGEERALIWDPGRRVSPEGKEKAELHHTTIWRWKEKLGRKALTKEFKGAWQRLLGFSGGLVADSTRISVRGVKESVHVICDGVSGVVMRFQRLTEETEPVIRGQFRALLARWGLKVEQVKVLVSDGAAVYGKVVNRFLQQARWQRSLFHLWRNVLPDILCWGEEAGEEAQKEFIAGLREVWGAEDLEDGQEKLKRFEGRWGGEAVPESVWGLVRSTLKAALVHTAGVVEGVGRTSNVAERFFRKYKGRVKRMGCFGSAAGCDHFNAAWEVYINFESHQLRKERKKKYRHPGLCPLQAGGVSLEGMTWLDALEV